MGLIHGGALYLAHTNALGPLGGVVVHGGVDRLVLVLGHHVLHGAARGIDVGHDQAAQQPGHRIPPPAGRAEHTVVIRDADHDADGACARIGDNGQLGAENRLHLLQKGHDVLGAGQVLPRLLRRGLGDDGGDILRHTRHILAVEVDVAHLEAKALLYPQVERREPLQVHVVHLDEVGQKVPVLGEAIILQQALVIGRVVGVEQHGRAIKALHQQATVQVGIVGRHRPHRAGDAVLLQKRGRRVQHGAGVVHVVIAFKQAEVALAAPGLGVAAHIHPGQHAGHRLVAIIGQEKPLYALGKQLVILAGQQACDVPPRLSDPVRVAQVDVIRQADKGLYSSGRGFDDFHMNHLASPFAVESCAEYSISRTWSQVTSRLGYDCRAASMALSSAWRPSPVWLE